MTEERPTVSGPRLKLYVWEEVLIDYTAGAMWALAESEEEARALIFAHTPYTSVEQDLKQPPDVYDHPVGFALYGGG